MILNHLVRTRLLSQSDQLKYAGIDPVWLEPPFTFLFLLRTRMNSLLSTTSREFDQDWARSSGG